VKGRLVANTGPVIALASIDRLDILRTFFSSVQIPQAVHDEIMQGGSRFIGLTAYRRADWLVTVPDTPLDPLLSSVLDKGEAAVITLARSTSADVVLIDESKARKIARTVYGLWVIGSARVLVEAKRCGMLDNVAAALQTMREHGYWIHDAIVQYTLREAGEAE
jgi:predicted nucleic acid-binding protein